jgi:hypothetical protein
VGGIEFQGDHLAPGGDPEPRPIVDEGPRLVVERLGQHLRRGPGVLPTPAGPGWHRRRASGRGARALRVAMHQRTVGSSGSSRERTAPGKSPTCDGGGEQRDRSLQTWGCPGAGRWQAAENFRVERVALGRRGVFQQEDRPARVSGNDGLQARGSARRRRGWRGRPGSRSAAQDRGPRPAPRRGPRGSSTRIRPGRGRWGSPALQECFGRGHCNLLAAQTRRQRAPSASIRASAPDGPQVPAAYSSGLPPWLHPTSVDVRDESPGILDSSIRV